MYDLENMLLVSLHGQIPLFLHAFLPLEAVKEKYNDLSIMRENPNFNANMEGIDRNLHLALFHSLEYDYHFE